MSDHNYTSIRLHTALKNLSDIYRKELGHLPVKERLHVHTFQLWYAAGCKFAAVAAGGSIYSLVLVSGLGMHASIGAMKDNTMQDLENLLRNPPKGWLRSFSN